MLYLAIIWFVFMVFLAYPILSNQTRVGNKAVLKKLNLMTQSNLYFYYTLLLFNGIYGYVQEYSTANMKNKPISTEWPVVLQGLTKVQDFMIYDLLDPVDGLGSDTELVNTVVGNLCEIYYIEDPILMGLCPTLGGSAVTKGLVGLSSYTIAALQSVQNHFVNSNKTREAMIEVLSNQDLINIEIFYPFTYMAYQKIDELIRAEIVKDFDHFNNKVSILVALYITLCLIMGVWIALLIKKRLQLEITDWHKMLRHLPYHLINESKALKNFINKTRGDTLGSN